ncbi:hypothetical protein BH10PSE7_BH10PSE7_22490 [soil metagenome]
MTSIPLKIAKDKLSELGHRAEAGETITITRHGKPAFDLVPHKPAGKKGGTDWEGLERFKKKHGITKMFEFIPEDFDDPLPEDILIKPLP